MTGVLGARRTEDPVPQQPLLVLPRLPQEWWHAYMLVGFGPLSGIPFPVSCFGSSCRSGYPSLKRGRSPLQFYCPTHLPDPVFLGLRQSQVGTGQGRVLPASQTTVYSGSEVDLCGPPLEPTPSTGPLSSLSLKAFWNHCLIISGGVVSTAQGATPRFSGHLKGKGTWGYPPCSDLPTTLREAQSVNKAALFLTQLRSLQPPSQQETRQVRGPCPVAGGQKPW